MLGQWQPCTVTCTSATCSGIGAWCRRAPLDLELETLLDAVARPGRRAYQAAWGQHRSEDHVPIVRWLRSDYPELFGHPDLLERLRTLPRVGRHRLLGREH